MRRVAITGISGFLGSYLVQELSSDPDIELILGLDLVPPSASEPTVLFQRVDVTRPFGDLFLEHWIDTAIHLAFVMPGAAGPDGRAEEQAQNAAAMSSFLEAVHRGGVLSVGVMSCGLVYGAGARPARAGTSEGPVGVLEDAPLRGGEGGFGAAEDKVAWEGLCEAFERTHPEVHLTRFRSAPLMGPGASHPLARTLARRPLLLPRAMTPLQVCHPRDLARAILQALRRGVRGPLNVAPGDGVEVDALAEIMGSWRIPVPRRALQAFSSAVWGRGMTGLIGVPPEGVAYLERSPRLSSRRLVEELHFRFQYSSRQAIEHFATDVLTRRGWREVLMPRVSRSGATWGG